jgi:caffeoyl-CoA O-methyltransferase
MALIAALADEPDQLGVAGLEPVDRLTGARAQLDHGAAVRYVQWTPDSAMVLPSAEGFDGALVHGHMVPEMPGLVPDDIERYVDEHTTPEPDHLKALAAETREKLSSPQMLSGHVEGRLLETLVYTTGAKRVLEFGTFSGYSALAMAAALPQDGKVVTLELSAERAQVARRHFADSPYGDRIELRLGPALEAVSELQGPFDLVFIDADKAGYLDYYEAALERLSPFGLIVVDNTLWSGRVVPERDEQPDESTQALRRFNDAVVKDDRVVCVMLTIRDGVTLIRKR